MKQLLIVNPGSTSTKLAVFHDDQQVFSKTISHTTDDLAIYPSIVDQKEFRLKIILSTLEDAKFQMRDFDGIIGIGGLLRKVESGVYTITDAMLSDLSTAKYGEHAANLGAPMVRSLSDAYSIPGFIADPITVDEMQPVARISGHPAIPRYGRTHTLNHKRVAMSVSKELNKAYEDCRFVVAHLGGGISIGAHCGGKIIDCTTSRGEGAFSMDRSGQLNSWELVKLCFSGSHTKAEVLRMLNGGGGVSAYLGTKDFRQVEQMKNEGHALAFDVFTGLAYQVAKEIAAMAAVLEGSLDAIILTGGIAYSEEFVSRIKKQIGFLGNIILRPGEEEMESLAFYLNSALSHSINIKEY